MTSALVSGVGWLLGWLLGLATLLLVFGWLLGFGWWSQPKPRTNHERKDHLFA